MEMLAKLEAVARVTCQPLGTGERREEDDRISAELNVVLQRRLRLIGARDVTDGSSLRA
jgi:hypothetical protein